jgi:DNA-directed RNA polymerase subunit beta'
VAFSEMRKDVYEIPGNWAVLVEDGDDVPARTRLAKRGDQETLAEHAGVVNLKDRTITIHWEFYDEREYEVASAARLRADSGDKVKAGEQLTEGSLNPNRILRILGREEAQIYLTEEVQRVYRSQGVSIHDKHIELIVRQMTNKVRITTSGDSDYLPGEMIDSLRFQKMNDDLIARGKRPATGRPILLGITKASLNTESFLSAASFQHTINVLAQAAIEGKQDDLFGLKENVIIGKLIPAGTGYHRYQQEADAEEGKGGSELDAETIFEQIDMALEDEANLEDVESDEAKAA